MSREYADNRIKDALIQAKGNPAKARQKVIAWAIEDPKLLQALAQPHLTGIVAHAINRVIHKQGRTEVELPPEEPENLEMSESTFGKEILSALQSGNTALFGHEGSSPRVARKQASQSHIDALKRMANKGKSKDID